MKKRKILDKLRFSLLITLLLSIYILSWTLIRRSQKLKSIWSPLLFCLEFISFLYLFLTNIRRGYVDYTKIDRSLKKGKFSKRFCRHCNHQKPERTHHCSTCGRCIKKMDHHCIWMGVCVNYDNHGDFVRFLLFSFLSNLYISMCYIYNIYSVCKRTLIISNGIIVLICIYILVSLLYCTVSTFLFKMQIKLILMNVTFLEEISNFEYEIEDNPYIFSKYNQGTLKNLENVFGPAYLLFLWRPQGDGISYNSNNNIPEPLYHSDYI